MVDCVVPKVVTEPSFERSKDFDQKAWDKKHRCKKCGKKTFYKEIAGGWICSSCYPKLKDEEKTL